MPATKFDKPIFPGAKLVSATVTVTNTSGSYSNTFLDERIATSMKADRIEVGDPSIFNDKISITTGDGSFTISCNSVAGSTSVTVSFLKIADDQTEVTSAEFDILNNRIGDLSSLSTTAKTNAVAAINENKQAITSNTQAIGNLSSLTTTAKTSLVAAVNEVDAALTPEIYNSEVLVGYANGVAVYMRLYASSQVSVAPNTTTKIISGVPLPNKIILANQSLYLVGSLLECADTAYRTYIDTNGDVYINHAITSTAVNMILRMMIYYIH